MLKRYQKNIKNIKPQFVAIIIIYTLIIATKVQAGILGNTDAEVVAFSYDRNEIIFGTVFISTSDFTADTLHVYTHVGADAIGIEITGAVYSVDVSDHPSTLLAISSTLVMDNTWSYWISLPINQTILSGQKYFLCFCGHYPTSVPVLFGYGHYDNGIASWRRDYPGYFPNPMGSMDVSSHLSIYLSGPDFTPTATITPTSTPTSTATPTMTPTEESMFIYSVSPKYSISGSNPCLNVYGHNFKTPLAVHLERTGQPSVLAANVNVVSHTYLTCDISLAGLAPGSYHLRAGTYPDYAILPNAFLVLNPVAKPVQWITGDAGQGGTPFLPAVYRNIAIGDTDQNGEKEIYSAGLLPRLIQHIYTGSAWSVTGLPEGSADEYFSSVVVCDANRDGTQEIYAATLGSAGKHVYQFTGSSFIRTLLGTLDADILHLACGDSNNDHKIEIYAACADGSIHQFSYTDFWSNTPVGSAAEEMVALAIGDGDNDSSQEIYAACNDNTLYQFKYHDPSGWVKSIVGASSESMQAVAVGNGDEDSLNEVYATNQAGKLQQYKWSGFSWIREDVLDIVSQALAIGDADTDGTDEIYCAATDGRIFQIRKSNNLWQTTAIGSAPSQIHDLAIGDADNDYELELYSLAADGHVYQCKAFTLAPTPTPTRTPIPASEQHLRVWNSRINPDQGEQARIRWYQFNSSPVNITIYNLLGDEVIRLVENVSYVPGYIHEAAWSGKNKHGQNVGSGIYIVYITSGDYKARTKVCVVK